MTGKLSSRYVRVDLFTGEIVDDEPAESPPARRGPDRVFEQVVIVTGNAGQVLTKSLRGVLNKAASEIKAAERERDAAVTLDEIAERVAGFTDWFKQYRRRRFNDTSARSVYPMELAKLWTEYRKAPASISQAWSAVLAERDRVSALRNSDHE